MKYTNLGKTGMKVSKLCLGTMNFGPSTDEKESFAIMDRALDAGVNFFDTADMYGGIPRTDIGYRGLTEEIIGRWFKQGGNRREKTILASKVACSMQNPEIDGPNDANGLSAFKIRRHLEDSLRRLQTDHLELYQMHIYDPTVTWDELWGVFESVVNQGKAYYIGASNFAARQLIYAQNEAQKRNFLGLVCDQPKYNLMTRLPELELLPTAKDLGLGLICYSPLNGGLLCGPLNSNASKVQRTYKHIGHLPEATQKQLSAYSDLCHELGEKETTVALAWLISNPIVTAPIVGPRTLAQFEDMLRAVDLELGEDVLKRLDEIFPGPGKY